MSTDVVEQYRQAWVRGGHMVGVDVDPASVPDAAALRHSIDDYIAWASRVMADNTTWTVLTQVDSYAPQQFAYAVRQAGLIPAWPGLLENWPTVPFLTGFKTMGNEAIRICQQEIRVSDADISMFQQLDQITAG